MMIDVRDYQAKHYHAYLFPDGHRVFIKLPSQCASFVADFRQVSYGEEASACDKVNESRNLSRNAIQGSVRKNRHLILNFPGFIQLSNSIYTPKSVDGKVAMVPVSYEGIATVRGQEPYATFLCRAIWKLHIVEAKDRIVDE
jgi:hypothetical protein